MFEHHHHPLLPRRRFFARVARMALIAAAIVSLALAIGTIGYHACEHLGWLDSFHSAAMILTGMGPPVTIETVPGKLFASAYALFSALIFLTVTAVLFAPLAHRMIHHFHLDIADRKEDDEDDEKVDNDESVRKTHPAKITSPKPNPRRR